MRVETKRKKLLLVGCFFAYEKLYNNFNPLKNFASRSFSPKSCKKKLFIIIINLCFDIVTENNNCHDGMFCENRGIRVLSKWKVSKS